MITDTMATQTRIPRMQPITTPATLNEPLLPVCPPIGTLGIAVIIPLLVGSDDDNGSMAEVMNIAELCALIIRMSVVSVTGEFSG